MKDPLDPRPLTEAEQREWLAQERAWRDECSGAGAGDDALAASYRPLLHALRMPVVDGLPADFARTMAACCAARAATVVRADTRLEQQVQRALLGLLAVAAIVAIAIYGGDWWQESIDALPLLGDATALNWGTALAACLGLSWATEVLRRRLPVR
jgi:hypothetical protein